MPSLSEVYRGTETGASLRRLLFGLGLFLAGALLVVSGMVVATTELVYGSDIAALTAKRQLGAVLAGVGIPSVFLGIFAVLPSGRLTKAAAVVGAGIALVGVALLTYAYPCHWSGSLCADSTPDLTLLTVSVYFVGAMLTFWCLFVGVANFKTRNDPGGTAMVNVTRRHETRYVPVERPRSGFGGIGFFGSTPDGEAETQTGSAGSGTASDGGSDAEVISSPLDDSSTAPQGPGTQGPGTSTSTSQPQSPSHPSSASQPNAAASGGRNFAAADNYCGNCAQFEYVRTDSGIQPYCAAHEELMDDMDPCEEWTPRPDR